MFTTHRPTLTLQLHNFDLFKTCRTAMLRDNWQDFNLHDASRGPSAIAELLVITTGLIPYAHTHTHACSSNLYLLKLESRYRPHRMHSICGLLLPMSHVTWSVCLSGYLCVGHTGHTDLVASASDCGMTGPRFESHRRRLCLSRQPLRYAALGTACAPLLQCLGQLSLAFLQGC